MVFKFNAPNLSGYKSNDNTGIHIFDFPDKEKEPDKRALWLSKVPRDDSDWIAMVENPAIVLNCVVNIFIQQIFFGLVRTKVGVTPLFSNDLD